MADKKKGKIPRHSREKFVLRYPEGRLSPDLFLNFVQLAPFEKGWASMKLDDDDLRALEVSIMADPTGPPVMQGTGGLRKMRFAPLHSDRGKSGGIRVCYCYFQDHAVVVLILAYPKSGKDNLTAAENNQIKALIEEIETYLRQRSRRSK